MSWPSALPSRRVAAILAVVAVALVVGAFALGVFSDDPTALGQVPDGSDAVADVDPAVLDDPTTTRLVETGLAAAGIGAADLDDVRAAFEGPAGLEAEAIDDAVLFGRYDDVGRPDPDYAAAIVHANWSARNLTGSLTAVTGVSYSRTTVDGTTVYRPGSDAGPAPSVAVLAEGEFAIGTAPAVGDAVGVVTGDADGLDGELRTSLSDVEGGLVTYAAAVSPAWYERIDEQARQFVGIDDVHTVAGAYNTTDDTVVLRTRLVTNGSEAASDVTGLTRAGIALAANGLDNATATEVVRSANVTQDDAAVAVSVETTVEELTTVARYYGVADS